MPKLWTSTVEAHRHEVREAVLRATGALILEHGLAAVTMARIAEDAGIGRATLYKYFTDLNAVLTAWHEQQIARHLQHINHIPDQPGGPLARLTTALESYALGVHQHGGTHLSELLHQGEHVTQARQQLTRILTELIMDAADAGEIRTDVPPGELAAYCLHALTAASEMPTPAAVRRLVQLATAGLTATPS